MNPSATAIYQAQLDPLSAEAAEHLVKETLKSTNLKETNLTNILQYFKGEPYLLFLFAKLYERHPETILWIQELANAMDYPETALLHFVYLHLSEVERKILSILSLIRHGATLQGLAAIIQYCDPKLASFDFANLDHSYIRLLLKKVYPPQIVLQKLENRRQHSEEDSENPEIIEAYYQLSEVFQDLIAKAIPEDQLNQYHERLQHFYMGEKNKHILQRVYPARIRHLIAEAQYHFNRSRRRRLSTPMIEPTPLETALALQGGGAVMAKPISSNTGTDVPLYPDPISEVLPDTASDDAVVRMPIAIQVEPNVYAPTPVHLTEADLQRLAQLIRGGVDYPPGFSPASHRLYPATESTPQNPSDPQSLAAVTEETDGVSLAELAISETDSKEQYYRERLQAAMTSHNCPAIARELTGLAQHRLQVGHHQNAELCLLKALDLANQERLPQLQLEIHGALGHLYQRRFQHNKALRHLKEMEHLYEAGNKALLDRELLATAYLDMADIHFYRKELKEALLSYKKCLALKPEDKAFQADGLFRLALALDEAGKTRHAVKYYRQSYDLAKALGDHAACAATLYNLASLYYDAGRLKEAEETLRRCLGYDKRVGSHHEVFRTLAQLSRIAEARGNLKQAEQDALDAFQAAQDALDKTGMATLCLRLGHLAERRADWKQAAFYYDQAQSVAADDLSEESRQLIQTRLASIQEKLV